MRLLIVEDDFEIAQALADGFARRGVASDRAQSAGDAALMLEAAFYAAAILDLGLPDGDGLELLRKTRARGDAVPVLILTARGDVQQRIAGLNAGADDYLVKPFDMDELQARLEAVLRRRDGYSGRTLSLGRLTLDPSTREVTVAGQGVALSAREIELLELLLRRAGRVVLKRIAEDQLFGLDDGLGSNAIEVYVHRLRRRIEKLDAGLRIETVRGVGYMLRAEA
ncbi:response regulator [Sphingomonas nostoxanthinifaciens]|uniref:response regulator n=1 Tax=Sphingomonas nostoxanthinifaciens TaxID=2872652 RepID=UPI001CC1FACE|nr:response regulator [Sphingomonas nostoxanthinifaciens]UAK25172.1 response regulator [Sphingomonas nostoxanthinifaciens]